MRKFLTVFSLVLFAIAVMLPEAGAVYRVIVCHFRP